MSQMEMSSNTNAEEAGIDVRQYLDLFRQWWWVVVITTIIAGVAAFFISRQMTPIYQASTILVINEARAGGNQSVDYTSLMTSERLAGTYSKLIESRPVMEEVIKQLKLNVTAEDLQRQITVTSVANTQIINVSVENSNPQTAANVANLTYKVFSERNLANQTTRFAATKQSMQKEITSMETQISQTRDDLAAAKKDNNTAEVDRLNVRLNQYEQIYGNLTLSFEQLQISEAQTISNVIQEEPAVAPTRPIRPNVLQNTGLAALIGLLLSTGGIIIYDLLDDTIKSPEEITRKFKLPVMGSITVFKNTTGEELITLFEPRSPVSESFRALRSNVQYASVDHPLHTLLVTSAAPSEGKTTVTSNLAVVLAQIGRHVTVVDADLHRPRVHRVFKNEIAPGLSSLFVQSSTHINGARQQTVQDSLSVIAAGELPPNPSELLGSNKMRDILDAICEDADIVLLDTPPLLAVSDTMALAPLVDGVLVVIRPDITKMSALKEALQQLADVKANVIGVVLNRVDHKGTRYGYYYGSHYSKRYNYSKYENQSEGPSALERESNKLHIGDN